MTFFDSHLLTLVIFLPLLFAAGVALLPASEKGQIRVFTLIGMLVTLAFGLWLYLRFQAGGPEFQFEYRAHWVDALGISYHTGVDGLSVSLVLLTGYVGQISLCQATFAGVGAYAA